MTGSPVYYFTPCPKCGPLNGWPDGCRTCQGVGFVSVSAPIALTCDESDLWEI